jgi:hypothetical protein
MGHDMKYVLGLSFAALLGGCAIAPAGYGDAERGYNHDNGNYLHREYNDGYHYRFGDRGEHGNQRNLAATSQAPWVSSS